MFDRELATTLVTLHPRIARMFFFLAGALLMLSFAPFGMYMLAPVLLIPCLALTVLDSPRRAASLGFYYGAGLFLAGTYWLYISIHVFGEAPLVIAITLMICLVIIMGLYYAATAWLISWFAASNILHFVVIAPAAWVVIEWLRGWFLSGFPWMSLGYGQIDSSLANFAPLFGVYGVSFLVLLSASSLTAAILSANRQRYLYLILSAAPWLAGMTLQQVEWTSNAGAAVPTTIVQGGVSQDRKWLREQFMPTLDLYRESISQHRSSELIVWPEVAIPAARDQVQQYVDVLRSDISPRNQALLFGILERDRDTNQVFNSVVSLSRDSEQVYRKRHLVPFGEYFPVPGFVREWMRMMSLPYSDISPGNAIQPLLSMPDGNKLSVAICYEDAYGAEQLYALPEATILINVSNDAWFGESIAPHQHLEIARMRAREVGRSVVRATNNGVSAFIGPRGQLVQTGDQFTYVSMSHDVEPRQGMTPYATAGNWPIIVFSMLIIGGFWVRRKFR